MAKFDNRFSSYNEKSLECYNFIQRLVSSAESARLSVLALELNLYFS